MKAALCSEDAAVKDARGVRGPGKHRTVCRAEAEHKRGGGNRGSAARV